MKGNNPHRQGNEPKQDLRRNVGDHAREAKVLELLTERTRVFRVRLVAEADEEGGKRVGGGGRRVVGRSREEEGG